MIDPNKDPVWRRAVFFLFVVGVTLAALMIHSAHGYQSPDEQMGSW